MIEIGQNLMHAIEMIAMMLGIAVVWWAITR